MVLSDRTREGGQQVQWLKAESGSLCHLPCDFTLGAGLRCLTLSLGRDQPSCREEEASLLVSRTQPISTRLRLPSRFLNATLQTTQTHCQEAGPAQQVTAHDKEMGSQRESVWEAVCLGGIKDGLFAGLRVLQPQEGACRKEAGH